MIQKQEIIISTKQGQSQRSISINLGISRTTVRKYLEEYRLEKNDHAGDGVVNPPKYKVVNRKTPAVTDKVSLYIDQCLSDNKKKKSQGNYKQCMAGTDIFDGLKRMGVTISYPTVARYIRNHKQKGNEIFIRQKYKPGSSSEFDWGYVKLIINGIHKSYMIAVFTSAYSNHRWAKLFVRQDMASLLQSHVEYLDLIKGVPQEIVYDNMKTAVALCRVKQSQKIPTDDLLKISTYYQFDYRFCNIAKGNEKGHVEKSVDYLRRKAFSPRDKFDSLEQANAYLQKKVALLNNKPVKGKTISINEELKVEQKYYHPLPVAPYDYAIINSYKMDKYHTISIDTNHYSVPESIHTPRVDVKLYPDKIYIYNELTKSYVIHARRHAKHQWFLNIDHYWSSLINKPGALSRSDALSQSSNELKELYQQYYLDIPKVFIQIMLYCKEHKITMRTLKTITIDCKDKCLNSPLSSDKIILMLDNRNTPQSQTPVNPSGTMSDDISNLCANQLAQTEQYLQSFK